MPKEIIEALTTAPDAGELSSFIFDLSHVTQNAVVYVRDQDGNPIKAARMERETLTDGSHVFNLVIEFEQAR